MQRLGRLLPACSRIARQCRDREALSSFSVHTEACVNTAVRPWHIRLEQGAHAFSSPKLMSTGAQSSPHANSLTEKLAEAGNRQDLSAILQIVESAGEEFDESAIESALLQVERCTEGMPPDQLKHKLHNTKTFQMLADMAVSTAGHTAPDVLARTIGVLGRLGFADQMVLDELARSLMPNVQKLDTQQMQQLVEGLRKADHSPGVLLLDAINERLSGLGADVGQQQADSIKQGLKDLGHEGDNMVSPAEPQQQTERIKYTRGGSDRSA